MRLQFWPTLSHSPCIPPAILAARVCWDRADGHVPAQPSPAPCTLPAPKVPGRAPVTESSPGSCGHGGKGARSGQPWCPSARALLYQEVTATKYQGLFFLSKLPGCCFFSKHKSICAFPSDGCAATSASLRKKHLCVCFSREVGIAKK